MIDVRVCISHESHYQLANRLAFACKITSLGIPTVLVYLGFTATRSPIVAQATLV